MFDKMTKNFPFGEIAPRVEFAMEKGHALREAIRRKWGHGGIKKLAAMVDKERQTIGNWIAGKSWPTELEPLFEEYLDLPRGYFSHVNDTTSDEDIISRPAPSPPPLSQIDISVEEYRQLLDLAPTDPASAERLERLRAHLKSHISLLLELTLSDRSMARKRRKKPDTN